MNSVYGVLMNLMTTNKIQIEWFGHTCFDLIHLSDGGVYGSAIKSKETDKLIEQRTPHMQQDVGIERNVR